MDEEIHFDKLQGGETSLPQVLSIMKFTAARIEEIKTLRKATMTSSATKLAFQTLPKHMRRRAMSHNPKRVPKGMRDKHINQMTKSGLPLPQKKLSRKHRRRPRNLQDEYVRRKRKISWLETHIWHAKRFHMVNRWGFRLPYEPCDKTFRACYRAISKHCLLQDISYFNCVSITGPLQILLDNFKNVCDSSIGITFAAKAYLNGKREGETILFTNKSVPKKPIGTVYFMWKPLSTSLSQNTRTIWIWIHAAFYKESLNTLIECFSLKCNNANSDSTIFVNNDDNVTLEELKFELSRFRLTGPLSTAVLQKTLKIATSTINNDVDWENNFLENPNFEENMSITYFTDEKLTDYLQNTVVENSKWFKDCLDNSESLKVLQEQKKYWDSMKAVTIVNEVPAYMILSLVVTDPRYSYPKKRKKAVPKDTTESNHLLDYNIPEDANKSWIWSKNIRTVVSKSKISNKIVNDLRSNLLVPGSDLHHSGAPIPVLLIQKPGCSLVNYGFGGGWDLIVPSGWGVNFWIALIMRGARPGGLREFNTLQFESAQQQFLTPDTNAGMEEELRLTNLYKQKYFARPPNKRPNYHKLSITNPFSFKWKELVKNWCSKNQENIDEFSVIKSRNILKSLQDYLKRKKNNDFIDFDSNYLVPIWIQMCNKGTPKMFATICLPDANDRLNSTPLEPLKNDPCQQKRKELRISHKLLLKKQRKERKKSNQKGNPNNEFLEKYKNEMEGLWLPSKTKDVRFSSSREIIGFVTKGNFCFTRAKNCALGYIALGSVPALIKNERKVLIRNTNSLQYKFAIIDVIV